MSTRKGEVVELVVPWQADDWVFLRTALAGPGSPYSSAGPQFLPPGAAETFVSSVRERLLMVVEVPSGTRIGALYWAPGSYAGSFEVGYLVADAPAWRGGVGAEALSLLLAHLFHSLNAHRVELVVGVFNRPLLETAAANSLAVEGVLRDHYFLDGTHHDAATFAVLRHEYYADPARRPADVISEREKDGARALLDDYLSSSGSRSTHPALATANGSARFDPVHEREDGSG